MRCATLRAHRVVPMLSGGHFQDFRASESPDNGELFFSLFLP